MLYLLAAKYIFGSNQLPGMVSKLSGTTKNLTAGLMQDPQKMENLISMVRTVAPLTSPGTVSKVNTYLPLFEKTSTLLGMYSFLNRAQTFRPIEPLNSKSPTDMISAFMKNGSMPMGKMLAQPLIANNMDKMIGAMAMNMMKNGGLNDLLSNGNISNILSSFAQNTGKSPENSGNIDINSLMETFMPLINSMNSNSDGNSYDYSSETENDYSYDNYNTNLKNESFLPEDEETEFEHEINATENFTNHRNYTNHNEYANHNDYNNYNDYNEHRPTNHTNEPKEVQKPIRIKQRRRR